ncbi:MAG: recombinase family protein [Patescibacteria group bacterium]
MEENEPDITKFKYVLYARKSTTDERGQIRSIKDQIIDCQKLSLRLGITVIGQPLIEKKSAKIPHRRPIFRKMINDIKAGTYDGILAWNPDRLARNMLEGGEIIDLIDQDIIKDLKFATHHFTKDANGKMLLGMAFVLSKQYSDDLSQKITRGVRGNFAEGKVATPKYGYVNEDGFYKPDGKNHELMCEAWKMRIQGTSIENIVFFLQKNDLYKIVKATGKKLRITMQKLSDIFKDPFYYGVLISKKTGNKIDLREVYNFKPAVSEEGYFAVQELTYHRIKPTKPHKMSFYPFRQMVYCSFCSSSMVVAPSTGHTKRYLFFRCDNENCSRKKKSIRAKIVVNFIYDFLQNGLNFSEAEYKDYLSKIVIISDEKRQKTKHDLHNIEGVLKRVSREISERSLKMVDFSEIKRVQEENANRIKKLQIEEEELKTNINKLKNEIKEPEKDRLTVEQFLNLSKNALNIVQSADVEIKDQITRLIFLNFFVDEEKVTNFRLKEPFATLIKQREFLSGGDGGS